MLLPNGKYQFQIESVSWRNTRSDTGRFLQLTMRCLDAPHEKMKIWPRFNLNIESQKAVHIAREDLKKMLSAANSEETNPKNFIGLKVGALIGVRHTPPFEAENVVKKWLSN